MRGKLDDVQSIRPGKKGLSLRSSSADMVRALHTGRPAKAGSGGKGERTVLLEVSPARGDKLQSDQLEAVLLLSCQRPAKKNLRGGRGSAPESSYPRASKREMMLPTRPRCRKKKYQHVSFVKNPSLGVRIPGRHQA